MHDVVFKKLEEHLSGKTSADVQAHLNTCAACRNEVESLAGISEFLSELRPDDGESPSPFPFFYTRVAASIAEQQNSSTWRLFSPGPAFFRRVAFTALVALGCLGSYFVMRENDASGTDAAAIMAQHEVISSHPDTANRDMMLVTLASYQE